MQKLFLPQTRHPQRQEQEGQWFDSLELGSRCREENIEPLLFHGLV